MANFVDYEMATTPGRRAPLQYVPEYDTAGADRWSKVCQFQRPPLAAASLNPILSTSPSALPPSAPALLHSAHSAVRPPWVGLQNNGGPAPPGHFKQGSHPWAGDMSPHRQWPFPAPIPDWRTRPMPRLAPQEIIPSVPPPLPPPFMVFNPPMPSPPPSNFVPLHMALDLTQATVPPAPLHEATVKPHGALSAKDRTRQKGSDKKLHLMVRNTFLTVKPIRTPSLERFFEERKVKSSPQSRCPTPPSDEPEEDVAAPLTPHRNHVPSGPEDSTFMAPADAGPADVKGQDPSLPSGGRPRWLRSATDTALADADQSLELEASKFKVTLSPEELQQELHLEVSRRIVGGVFVASPDMPSRGSALHRWEACKPCAFVFEPAGCMNNAECEFCHLCEPGEKKRRRKDRRLRNQAAVVGNLRGDVGLNPRRQERP